MVKYRLALIGTNILAILSYIVYVLYVLSLGWILWVFIGSRAWGEDGFADRYALWISNVKENLEDKLEDYERERL